MIQIPKGCKDMLPADAYLWQAVEDTARESAKLYGFKEIRTPVFEHTELFLRGVGDTTDIVNKEMYTFLDKGGRSITLRPEGTAGVARAFVENGLQGGAMPFKAYYLISAFRYERPQAGRLREFHQFGAELYGAASPVADAEAILLASHFLRELGLEQYTTLRLNSIGCKSCRARYAEALRAYFRPHIGEMCEDCRERLEKNPMRILDCKNEGCKKFTSGAPSMLDYLCDDCRAHFDAVKSLLDTSGIGYTVDPRIVRGLDYYSRTVFEFTTDLIGAQATVLGGGRYDGLLEQMDAKPTPAVGFAAGIERLLLALQALDAPFAERLPDVYIAGMDATSRVRALSLAEQLRGAGLITECDLMDRSLKAQFKYADKLGVRFVVVLGEEELASGEAQVKHLSSSTAERVKFDEIAQYIKEYRRRK